MCVTLIGKESRHFSFLHESFPECQDAFSRLWKWQTTSIDYYFSKRLREFLIFVRAKKKKIRFFFFLSKSLLERNEERETFFPRPSSPFQMPNATNGSLGRYSFLLVFFFPRQWERRWRRHACALSATVVIRRQCKTQQFLIISLSKKKKIEICI